MLLLLLGGTDTGAEVDIMLLALFPNRLPPFACMAVMGSEALLQDVEEQEEKAIFCELFDGVGDNVKRPAQYFCFVVVSIGLLPLVANSGGVIGCSPCSSWNFLTSAFTELVGDVSVAGALRITLGVVGASGNSDDGEAVLELCIDL